MVFSTIIPVYNVEKYLEKCLDSVLNQTFKDLEIILVDDGSTDNSGAICEKYALLSDRVKVIHQNNEGPAGARNSGLRVARGEYVVFVDSDDYIESESFNELNIILNKANKPDLIITRAKLIFVDKIILTDKDLPFRITSNSNKSDIIKWMFTYSDSLWPSMKHVVKKKFIDSHGIVFHSGCLHEDIDWTVKIYFYADTFAVSNFYWYNRRKGRSDSITAIKNHQKTLDIIYLVSKNIKRSNVVIDERSKIVMCQRLLRSIFPSLNDYKYYNKEGKRLVVDALVRCKDIYKYASIFRHKLFLNFSKVFGFRTSLFLLSMLIKR